MTTYRSAREFGERFDAAIGADSEFPVERYLQHCGRQFAVAWRPERFLALSLSADLHRVNPADVRVPTTLVAAEGDQVVPRTQIDALARALGAPVSIIPLETRYGHDAFLTEPAKIGQILQTTLAETFHD
jgi:homoserine O-acetyltransferase